VGVQAGGYGSLISASSSETPLVQCLLYNIESLLKRVIKIDAKLKPAISDAIGFC
jgi:hypothetical protein